MVTKKPDEEVEGDVRVGDPRVGSEAWLPNSTLASRAAANAKRVAKAENKAVKAADTK